ncbi:MAG: ECF transporter S component [Niameybacter sp.]|uniref:ECF transporter S component n=1 Tax=Niameybacter sp. TaxID=2033640 RepID=UPI002FC70E64
MQNSNKLLSTQNIIKMAFLSAIAAILMQWGIKLPAIFPSFLEIDFSEVPALVAILTINPWAGIVVVVIKNLLKGLLFGSSTGYVGELANMLISIGYVLPLTLVVRKSKEMRHITKGIIGGIFGIMITGAIVNYFITIPLYAQVFMPMETIIEIGHAIIPAVTDKFTLVMLSITPFNLVKGTLVAVASVAFIKALQPALKYLMPKKAA